jgi:hypothetical protein
LLALFTITVSKIVLVRFSVTSANESFDRKISNIGDDLINNPYVSIYESVRRSLYVLKIFLLPMNGVNMKYWFRDFQKKFFYWFSGRIRTFYRRKTGFYEKKISVALPSAVCRDFMAVHMKILSARFLKDAFNLETSPSGSLTELV